MILAGFAGCILLLAFLAFLYNLIMILGLEGLVGIFRKPALTTIDLVPEK